MAAQQQESVGVCTETMTKVDVARKKKQFRWTDEMIESLIKFLHKFKSTMEFKNLDFDGDRIAQYSWLREEMARISDDDDLFGPVVPYCPNVCIAEMREKEKLEHKTRSLADKESIKKGYSRIKEKVLNNILKVGTCLVFYSHVCMVL